MRILVLSCAALALAACNKTEAPPPAPPAPVVAAPPPPAAPPAPPVPAVPSLPSGVPTPEQIAQLQKQALGAAGVQQQKPAVNWRVLMPILGDEIGGWKARGEAKGQTTAAAGMSISQVTRDYEKGGKQLHVEVADTAVMPMLATAFQMARSASSDSSDGYARAIDVGGNPGWDQWHKGGNAEIMTLVASRFLVKAQVSDLPDSKAVADFIKAIDLGKLAALDK